MREDDHPTERSMLRLPYQEGRDGSNCAPGRCTRGKARDRRQKKTPTSLRLGSSTTTTPLAPFPSKGSPVENQAGVLARGTYLLSAPSQGSVPQWYPQISFHLQLRGSAGFTPSSLLTALDCEATWLCSTNKLCVLLYPHFSHAIQNKCIVWGVRTCALAPC